MQKQKVKHKQIVVNQLAEDQFVEPMWATNVEPRETDINLNFKSSNQDLVKEEEVNLLGKFIFNIEIINCIWRRNLT